jgi:hypothetical protein
VFAQHSVAGFPLIDDQSVSRENINEHADFQNNSPVRLTGG